MTEFKFSPFRTTRLMQAEIQEFLDTVSMAVLAYQEGMTAYLKEGWLQTSEEKLQQISAYQSRGNSLRTHIGLTLYTEMLLPDTAADVLGLLSDLDHLVARMSGHFTLVDIEKPELPSDCSSSTIDFINHGCSTMEHTVSAARIYFRDPKAVNDQTHKIHYHKQEAEKLLVRILKTLFAGDYPLERKYHLRDHLVHIGQLTNQADETADTLAIYAVKRSI